MRKKVKRVHITLLILIALAGILLGVGATLLCLNLTTENKGLTLYGLICLIVVAALCLLLPFLTQYRDNLMERLKMMNMLFGQEVSFLDEERFMKAVKGKSNPIYGLHLRLFNEDELIEKISYYALSNALDIHLKGVALIGYRNDGNFLLLPKDEKSMMEALKQAHEAMLGDDSLPPFSILLGVDKAAEDAMESANHAVEAAMKESSVRPSLSLEVYKKEVHAEEAGLDIKQEEQMERLSFSFDEYECEGEKVAFVNPDLYDAGRGHVQGKDLFHRAGLFHAREALDERSFDHALSYLKEHAGTRVVLRLGKEKVESAGFLSFIVERLKEAEISPDSFYLLLNAVEFDTAISRAFIAHAKGLGFHLGVYEYGGEDALALMKMKPEFITLKPENVRLEAPKAELDILVNIVKSLHIPLLIEEGCLGVEHSDFKVKQEVIEEVHEEAPNGEEIAVEEAAA